MEGFQDLFTNFDTQDSYAILAIMFVALLFGMLIGFLLRATRIRKLKKELKEEKKKLSDSLLQNETLLAQQVELEKKLKQAEYNLATYTDKLDELEKDKAKLLKDVYQVNQSLEEAQTSNREYVSTIATLKDDMIKLKLENSQLAKEVEEEDQQVDNMAQMQSLYNATRQQLTTFESRLTHLDEENEVLKTELAQLKSAQEAAATVEVVEKPAPAILSFVDEPDTEPDPDSLTKIDKPVLNEKIIIEDHEKDDLTLINGIGPFIEKKLNDIGIYTYQQISEFDAEKIEQVTRDVAYFPGRIEKDDWVGQAKELANLKSKNPSALKKKASHPTNTADLKIIEGIGPKIEQLLKEGGINNWQDLAEATLERLQEILTAAGERYRIHDPNTWSNQATLAAAGKWDELNQYQDELKGGRVVE